MPPAAATQGVSTPHTPRACDGKLFQSLPLRTGSSKEDSLRPSVSCSEPAMQGWGHSAFPPQTHQQPPQRAPISQSHPTPDKGVFVFSPSFFPLCYNRERKRGDSAEEQRSLPPTQGGVGSWGCCSLVKYPVLKRTPRTPLLLVTRLQKTASREGR